MKKLMILAAVAMAVCASSAATAKFKWVTGTVNAPGSDGAKQSGVVAEGANWYVIGIESTDYATLLAMSYEDAAKSIWETYGGDNLPGEATKTIGELGTANFTEETGGKTDKWIASILTYQDETGNDWYIANVDHISNTGTGTVTSPNKMAEAWIGKDAGAIGSWQSVPEPTSGLLLLLGVAGLALRRRRA